MISKFKYIIVVVLFILTLKVNAQIGTVNYVIERSLLVPETDEDKVFDTEAIQNISYFDGLGRPIQQISMNQSPTGADIVQIVEYDNIGRQAARYLPHTQADNSGAFIPVNEAKTVNNNFYKALFPLENEQFSAVTNFDGSPLNRPVEQGAPGNDWQIGGASAKFAYGTNTGDVARWSVSGDGMSAASYTTDSYRPSSLYVNTTTDENGNQSKEYKNQLGQVVLSEAADGFRTYYIYDNYGLLRCVVPPLAEGTIDADTEKLCYFYRYDKRGRMITKRIPGADSICMVYDKKDRLVLSQDGNMRMKNQWMATLYDNLNRPIKTGIFVSEEDAETLTEEFETYINYLHSQNIDELSQTFYDGYSGLEVDYKYINPNKDGYETSENTAVKGQITYTKTKVPDLNIWLITINYYDHKYRVIQTIADNHLGGRDIISNKYDFIGKILETTHEHTSDFNSQTIVKRFIYDHTGRLLETKMKHNKGDTLTTSANDYNELAQLKTKKIHEISPSNFRQNVDYQYNIRGWMTHINNPLSLSDDNNENDDYFAMQLDYNAGNNPEFNGNISSISWASKNFTDVKTYNYTYDNLNRLEFADYETNTDYDVNFTYDLNGNIKTLERFGQFENKEFGNIDNLSYNYNGNQLTQVDDIKENSNNQTYGYSDRGSFRDTEYYYDANGNMVKDLNKGIDTIYYNQLNLPDKIEISRDETKEINYIYDAVGIKLQKNIEGVQTDYIGNMIYENNKLKYIFTDGGRIVVDESSGTREFKYQYHLTDHLGNPRVTFDTDGNVLQEDSYYPFGMTMNGLSYTNPDPALLDTEDKNKFLYNGKELDDEFGVNLYDYGWRQYDASIARWHVPDPVVEYHFDYTPYAYVYNNPLNYIDPFGLDTINANNGGGKKGDVVVFNDGTTTTLDTDAVVVSPKKDSETEKPDEESNDDRVDGDIDIDYATHEVDKMATVQCGYPLAFGRQRLVAAAITLTAAILTYSKKQLLDKYAKERTGIQSKSRPTPGFQYSLRATVSGRYPNVRGGTVLLNSGDVWKYGETTQGQGRYSPSELNAIGPGVRMQIEFYGSQTAIKLVEKSKIYSYFMRRLRLPPGNRIFR